MRTEQRRTQNTVVYSVKSRIFNGLRGVGTVYCLFWYNNTVIFNSSKYQSVNAENHTKTL